MIKVAFCFIVKDGEKYLEKNIIKIINLANKCKFEYKIYYAENDSNDNTNNILQKLKKQFSNINGIHLKIDNLHSTELCKNDNYNYNCSNRVRRLAYLRNIVLDQAKLWNECEYLIMLDLDFIDFDENEFINMFNIINDNPKIDGIFGMSVNEDNSYYDVGAINSFYHMFLIYLNKKIIKVNSAFGGFGIYRFESIKNIKYNENTNDIEHIDFNKNLNNLYVYNSFNPVYNGTAHIVICYKLIIFIILFLIIIIYFMN